MKTYNGKIINELQHLKVIALEDNVNYLVVGGKYDLLFEKMPSVDDLNMLIVKPKNSLTAYEQSQLNKTGNVLISKQPCFNDNSNLFNNWYERQVELEESGY